MNQKEIEGLLKVNDIRAVYGSELKDEHAYEIGKAFVTYIGSKKIVVGRDGRVSSPALAKAFMKGANECGVDVIDVGVLDTPGLYFATAFLNLPGVMITASHNPAKYNGIKFCRPPAIPIGEINGMEDIAQIALSGKYKTSKKKGKVVKKNIWKQYTKHVLSFANIKKLNALKAVFDVGNGMGGIVVPETYKKLPLKITKLYFKVDGNFPNHVPNPAINENLADLQKKVLETKADYGVALDGDCDRAVFVDEKGEIVNNSVLACVMFDNYFAKEKNKRTIYSSTCSKIFKETVEKAGGMAMREKVGHLFIKARMRKEDSVFGCEETGHFYYKDNFYADSGIITSIVMYEILSRTGKKLSELSAPYKKYAKAEEVSLKVEDRKAVVKAVEEIYKSRAKTISHDDGLIIEFGDYWFSVKPANTEPLLRINIEGNDKKILQIKQKELLNFIENFEKKVQKVEVPIAA